MSEYKVVFRKNVNGSEHDYPALQETRLDPKDVHGGEICPIPYCNTFFVAKTGGGKTSALGHMLKCCAGNALIVAFVPTIEEDGAWIKLRKKLKKNGNKLIVFSSIEEEVDEDEDFPNPSDDEGEVIESKKPKKVVKSKIKKVDRLKELILHFRNNPTQKHSMYKGKICPRVIVIMDDMPEQLKHPTVAQFMKTVRHMKSKFIVSTQGVHDMLPQQLVQVRQWLLFRGLQPEKIEKIRKDAGIPIDHDVLWKIYSHATRKPFSFLMIIINGCDFEYWGKYRHKYDVISMGN